MKKTIAILLIAILAVSLLAACGNSTEFRVPAPEAAPYESMTSSSNSLSAPYSSGGGVLFNAMMGSDSYADYDYAEETAYYDGGGGETGYAPAPSATPMPGSTTGAGNNSLPETSEGQPIAEGAGLAEKIIYTASADIEAVDFDETLERVQELINFNNAFIESSYVGGRNYVQSYYGYQTYRSASYTLRIPKDRFKAVTESLDILGNVISLSSDAVNITSQFRDVESHLSSYKIQEERLLTMLEKTDTVADMIEIESRLAEVRYSIESFTSTLNNWQNQVDYSTLTLYIREVEEFTEYVPIQRSYWQQVGDGLQLTIRSVGRFFRNLFKWVIVNLPVLAILAVIVVIVVIIVRRKIRKRRNSNKDGNNDGIE